MRLWRTEPMRCGKPHPTSRTGTGKILALAALLTTSLAHGAQPLEVAIVSPQHGEPVFGEVELEAEVYPPGAQVRVEFFLDGEKVGEADGPPYRITVEAGEATEDHRFEVRAHGAGGEVAEAFVESKGVAIADVIEAELQQLYVTVVAGDRRVLDLAEGDFRILDDGATQSLVTFARGDVRIVAALLIDASASMRGQRLRGALRGAAAFVSAMTPEDDASILVFSDRLLHATPFANDPRVLTQGLAGVAAAGGTALNDHLYLGLKRLEAQQGRRVVVLLSDGIDSHSALRMRETHWLARRSRALVYWIRTDPRDREGNRFSAWKDPGAYRAEYELLSRTVAESGGRIVTLDSLEGAEAAFRDILRELREQYVLGFYPLVNRNDGSWHRIDVQVSRPGLAVRSQAGYIDY